MHLHRMGDILTWTCASAMILYNGTCRICQRGRYPYAIAYGPRMDVHVHVVFMAYM